MTKKAAMDGDDGKVHFAKKRTIIDRPRGANSLLHGGFAYLSQPTPPETLVPNDRGVRKFEARYSQQQPDFRPGRRCVPHREYSEPQMVALRRAQEPPSAKEKPQRPLKRYLPEKSGFDYPEDFSMRPIRRVGYPKQGTLHDNPSQVSMEQSFGRKGRVPQQPTEEPTGHKAAVYQPGYFKQENKYLPSSMLEANATLTATQRKFRKTQERKQQAMERDQQEVFELTNNVTQAGQLTESWERRTGMYVWKSKKEK